MNVLKKLATPFIAIWRWIKETAWVQPLLIVGVIFAIIFSIPSITKWVQSWDFGDDTYSWLQNKQLSLEGVTDKEFKGQAIDFLAKFNEAENAWQNGKKDDARNLMKDYTSSSNKMFLYFVQENDAAKNLSEASKELAENQWKDKILSEDKDAGEFTFRTIFTDQKVEVKENDTTYDEHTPYDYFIKSGEFELFFSTIFQTYQDTAYCKNIINKKVTDGSTEVQFSSYESSINSFRTNTAPSAPTIFVIDLSDKNTSKSILTSTVFTVLGSNKIEKCNYLAEAWLGKEDFAF